MSRKQQVGRPRPVSSDQTRDQTSAPLRSGMLAWLVALFAARWLIPTEGAVEGLTLWLVQLVLLTALARTIWAWRFDERPFRFDAMDGAIAWLIVAQVVSALGVVFGVGNSRAAINLAWEWVGSGVLIWLIRQELRATRAVMPLCLGLSLTASVLAGYGLWQHYVWYDQVSREYDRLVADHDRLVERLRGDGVSPVSVSAADVRKLESLRAAMARQQIPIEKADRKSLELRLKASSEPLGLFALTNSFAGLLVVMGLISAGLMGGGRSTRIVSVLFTGLIAYCVLLTKSRTAMVGLFAGTGWWLLRIFAASRVRADDSRRAAVSRRIGVWTIVGLCVVGSAVGVAALSGGWDRAVLSEAPKSLRYRLEWWHGTWATIREHLWIGTGPGNFRDYYLAHKLPESSEEIADPHNFIFDVWANAGTFGLMGMLACVGLMVREVFQPRGGGLVKSSTGGDGSSQMDSHPLFSAGVWGIGLAFPLSAIGLELMGHGTEERLWWLGGIWWGLWLVGVLLAQRTSFGHFSEFGGSQSIAIGWSLEAANVALLVHLLGAGGIAMPAITQLLWLVWAMRVACSEFATTDRIENSPSETAIGSVETGRLPLGITALAIGGLSVLCWSTATLPELSCRSSLQLGDAEWERSQLELANAKYLDASRADPHAIEPLDRLADVAFQRWQATHAESDFEAAVKRLEVICARLPFASRPFRRLGQLWMARFDHSHEVQHAAQAALAYAAAVERYPHHAALLSEWATANEQANLIARAGEVAQRAIRQDDLNRQAGHSDKFLDGQTRQRMERLATAAPDPN